MSAAEIVAAATLIVGSLAGALAFVFRRWNAAQEKVEHRLETALADSNRRHERCQEQHDETKGALSDVRVKLAGIEGRVEGYEQARADITGLTTSVLELLEERKAEAEREREDESSS